MSMPPNNNPQSGFGQTPPLTPKAGLNGCWKAAGIGCALLFLLALAGVFFAGRFVKEQLAHPKQGSIWSTGLKLVHATQDGQKIQQAVVAYHAAHGKYPNTLMTLVADGSLDGKLLHSDLDPNPNPGHISWHYVKPDESTPQTAPILIEQFHLIIPGAKPPTADGTVIIDLNGKAGSAADTTSPPAH